MTDPEGETHHDWGILGYHTYREKLVLRQSFSERFVHQYVLKSADLTVLLRNHWTRVGR